MPLLDFLADLDETASELVSEDYGIVHRPGMVDGPLMQVAAVDPDVADLEEEIPGIDGGAQDFADYDGSGFGAQLTTTAG